MTYRLGRVPSTPDERDYQLRDWLGTPSSLQEALKRLERSLITPRAVKNWAEYVTAYLEALPTPAPAPAPAPAPTPDPTPTPTPSSDVIWQDDEAVLDQGDYGTCVGNGWAQWGNTQPIDDRYDETAARAIYYESTVIGGSPDNPDAPGGGQQGSTVRDGAKAMQKRKRVGTYAFASSVDEIAAFVDQHGPVVMGTDWTDDMFNPDADGYIKPTGNVAGGHCYVCIGHLPDEDALEFLNSWGESWGLNGRFKMKKADVAHLLSQQGEACAAVELAA